MIERSNQKSNIKQWPYKELVYAVDDIPIKNLLENNFEHAIIECAHEK